MKKIIILSIVALSIFTAMDNLVYAYEIIGNKVFYDSPFANMTVKPHTIINPERQWQEFRVNTKGFSGDLCVAYLFNHSLESGSVQLKNNDGIWIDKTSNFNHVNIDGTHFYISNTYLHFNEYTEKSWRIRYKPQYSDGKWELWAWNTPNFDCQGDLQGALYNKIFKLDPWWSSLDSNVTIGFVNLTNRSTSNTFEYYDYLLYDSFDGGSRSLDYDAVNFGYPTDRVEGDRSYGFDIDISNNVAHYGRLYFNQSSQDISNYTTFGFWFYTNASGFDCPTGIQVVLGSGAPDLQYYDIDCGDIGAGWNKFEFEIDSPDSVGGSGLDPTNLITAYFWFYNNDSIDMRHRVDHFYFYNSSNYFNSSNWQIGAGDIPSELQYTGNGYGFNSTMISLFEEDGNKRNIYRNLSNYENYEIILKFSRLQDFGSELIALSVGAGASNRQCAFVGQGLHRFYDGIGSYVSIADYTSSDGFYYLKFTEMEGFQSWYYSTDMGQSWTLALNYTQITGSYSDNILYYLTMRTQTVLDNFVVRELLSYNVSSGYYEPSFAMTGSNETEIISAQVEWFNAGSLRYTDTYNYPTDSTDFSRYLGYYGEWYANVSICDAYSCAWNITQTINVLSGVNIGVYDEQTKEIIDETVTMMFRSESYETEINFGSGSVIFNLSELPPDVYQVIINSSNYYHRSYYITVTNESLQYHNFYLLRTNNSNIVSIYVHDVTDQAIENISLIIMRQINLSWTTISHRYTDEAGSMQINLDPFYRYYFLFQDPESRFLTKGIYLEPVFDTYTFYLDNNQSTNFSTVWDYVTYDIGIINSTLNPILTNFTLTVGSSVGNIDYFGIFGSVNGTNYSMNITTSPSGGIAWIQMPLNYTNGSNLNVSYYITTTNPHDLTMIMLYSVIDYIGLQSNYSIAPIAEDLRDEFSVRMRILLVLFFSIMSVSVINIFVRLKWTPMIGIPILAFFAIFGWIPVWIVVFNGLTLGGFILAFGD